MRKKIGIFLLMIFCIVTFSIEGYTSLLVGDENGRVYYSKNISEKHPIASVTKIMTIMVVYDQIRDGKIAIDDKVEISEKARGVGGSMIWIPEGAKLTVIDLIKATAIYSANNAAYALAEYVSHGDVDSFVETMNDKAFKLGLDDELDFYTPMGLPPAMTGKNMDIGTAFGIYKLSMEALKYPEYVKIASLKDDWIQGGTQRIWNRNKLLSKENGVFGMKTGHHLEAGYNISVVAERNGLTTITVVFGSPDEKTRDKYVLETLKEFYEEFHMEKLVDKTKPMAEIEVRGGKKERTYAYPDEDFQKVISKKWEVKIEKRYARSIDAPIKKGDVLGSYQLLVNGKVTKNGRLCAIKNIEKENFIDKIRRIF